ncbi:MAG TPA: malectin domain-containing carbohydrate-binding protein, partial [Chthoniobacterales bacterium]
MKLVSGGGGGSGGSNSSVHYFYGLGSTGNGRSGGRLLIESEKPSAALYNPSGIVITAGQSVRSYLVDGVLSQALSDSQLTTVNVTDATHYEIRSYHIGQVTNASSAAGPWTVSNPGGYFKKTIVENPGPIPIADTEDDGLYHTERTGQSFGYELPVVTGDYLVTLHFCENFQDGAGARKFDVSAEGAVVLDGYDIFAAAGGANIARRETFPVTVGDGALNLGFATVLYQAEVSGIEVSKAPVAEIANTDDDALYQTERTGDFACDLALPNGDYAVVLEFAERYYDAAGARVFNVAEMNLSNPQNPALLLDHFDIRAAAGARDTAVTRTLPVAVTDGQLNLRFAGVTRMPRLAALRVYQVVNGQPASLVAAINAGGGAFTAADGTAYSADAGFTGGAAESAGGGDLVAIHAGGEELTAADGTVFASDTGYSGGKSLFSGGTGVRFTEMESGAVKQVYDFSWAVDPLSGKFGDVTMASGAVS